MKKREGLHVGTTGAKGCEENAILVAVAEPETGFAPEKTVGDSEKASWPLGSSRSAWLCKHVPLMAEEVAAMRSILFQFSIHSSNFSDADSSR